MHTLDEILLNLVLGWLCPPNSQITLLLYP